MYSKEVKKNVKSGRQLAAFTNSELEAKLGMENFLHRKKVLLAVMTRAQSVQDVTACLDHQWVTRWLDDVGLPQYKEACRPLRVRSEPARQWSPRSSVGSREKVHLRDP